MTVRECYALCGGNYEDALCRLSSDVLLAKFLRRFPGDPSFASLCKAMEEGNAEEAFRAVHTLKGVCMTLSLDRLGNAASEMTEALRKGDAENAIRLFPTVREAYETTVNAIYNIM